MKPHHHPNILLTTSAKLGLRFPFGLTVRCRKALGFASGITVYPPELSKMGKLDHDDRFMEVRLLSVAELSATGCKRRLQVKCYQCKHWVSTSHYYCQHVNSATCRRLQGSS